MATCRIIVLAVAFAVLAVTATAGRDAGIGRALKQAPAPAPTVAQAVAQVTDPFSQFLSRTVTFLQNDAAQIQANVQNTVNTANTNAQAAVQGANNYITQIPAVAAFETQLANALAQVQLVVNQVVSQGQALGNNAQEQLYQALSTINADLTSANPVGAVVQTAARAMPPAIVGR